MIALDNSTLSISGPVNHATVPALLKSLQSMVLPKALVINTAKIETVDSTAISLILHISRQCKGDLTLVEIPKNLEALLHLYDLDTYLCPALAS